LSFPNKLLVTTNFTSDEKDGHSASCLKAKGFELSRLNLTSGFDGKGEMLFVLF